MLLDDEDETTKLFCILMPQSADRSMKGVQALRPYEIHSDTADGKSFRNNFMLLAARKTNVGIDTLTTIRSLLTSDELEKTASPPKRAPKAAQNHVALGSQFMRHWMGRSQQTVPRVDHPKTNDGELGQQTYEHMEAGTSLSLPSRGPSTPTREIEKECESANGAVKTEATSTPTNRPQIAFHGQHRPSTTSRSTLTEQEAQHVNFVWTLNIEGDECELVHELARFHTFQDLLKQLRKESQLISPTAAKLAKASVWRMTYMLPGQQEKKVIISEGTEAAYIRLQQALAQSTVWNADPNSAFDVALEPLISRK